MRSVITGGPGCGKSTLLDALSHAGMSTMPEVARDILRRPDGMDMRANDPQSFAQAMFAAQMANWKTEGAALVIHDRGFADIVGFLELEGLPVPPELDQACRSIRYDGPVFRAPPWPEIYVADSERIQTWQEAVESDAAICAAWRKYGYELIDLPLESVERRVWFVLDALPGKAGGE